MSMAKCKGCGAPIEFIRLNSGKQIPVNPKPVYVEDKAAKEIIVTADGRISNGRQEPDPPVQAIRGYISHFSTCPMAGAFRKRRK